MLHLEIIWLFIGIFYHISVIEYSDLFYMMRLLTLDIDTFVLLSVFEFRFPCCVLLFLYTCINKEPSTGLLSEVKNVLLSWGESLSPCFTHRRTLSATNHVAPRVHGITWRVRLRLRKEPKIPEDSRSTCRWGSCSSRLWPTSSSAGKIFLHFFFLTRFKRCRQTSMVAIYVTAAHRNCCPYIAPWFVTTRHVRIMQHSKYSCILNQYISVYTEAFRGVLSMQTFYYVPTSLSWT